MKIHPAIVLAAVALLAILIWFFSTAEFSNTGFSATDYVSPITDGSGGSLSGANLIVMDPVSGNMKLAPVDTFNTNTQANLNKVVSVKVPGQIDAVRGSSGQTKYTGSLRDLHTGLTNRYTKSQIDTAMGNRYTKTQADSKFIEFNDNVYIRMGPGHSGSNKAYNSNRYLHASTSNFQAKFDGGRGGKWRLEKAPNAENSF